MTNSKSSASYVVSSSICVMHLTNDAQFSKETLVAGTEYHLLLKCKHCCN